LEVGAASAAKAKSKFALNFISLVLGKAVKKGNYLFDIIAVRFQ